MMARHLAVLSLVVVVTGSTSQSPCFNNNTIADDGVTKCIVEDRSSVPTFPEDAEYEIFFLTHPVHGTGVEISQLMGFIHTATGIRRRNSTEVYTFEFWALHFNPTGVLIPRVENGTLHWSSEAIVTWTNHIVSAWVHEELLGITTGKVLNGFMDWVPKWHQQHKYYQMFSVWNQPELGSTQQQYLKDTTCNTFTEDGFNELVRLGASLTSKDVLCRTYIVLNAAAPVQTVDQDSDADASKRLEELLYYSALDTVFGEFKNMTVAKALELLGAAFMEKRAPAAFVYDRDGDTYYKALLKRPYMEVWPRYLSQRMVLPWQPKESANAKECDPWAAPLPPPQSTVVV
jgi:hypothetical protein